MLRLAVWTRQSLLEVYGIIEHSTMDEEGDYLTVAAQCM